MGNTYFQFKEFRIEQDRCAMKVCTDSCLFGAWVPVARDTQQILDIGTGTGLLALIMAQRTTADIDAVEIEPDANQQATENAAASTWKERVHIFHADIAGFQTTKKYDLIICNPPFYEDNLKSKDHGEKIAKHDAALTLEKLLQSVEKLIHANSRLALLLPYYRRKESLNLLEQSGWYMQDELLVNNKPGEQYFRHMAVYGREISPVKTQTLSIYQNERIYTPEFTVLLSHLYFS